MHAHSPFEAAVQEGVKRAPSGTSPPRRYRVAVKLPPRPTRSSSRNSDRCGCVAGGRRRRPGTSGGPARPTCNASWRRSSCRSTSGLNAGEHLIRSEKIRHPRSGDMRKLSMSRSRSIKLTKNDRHVLVADNILSRSGNMKYGRVTALVASGAVVVMAAALLMGVNGTSTTGVLGTIPMPPQAGFNPLTATQAQLAANGFPPRPAAKYPQALKEWTQAVGGPTHWVYPQFSPAPFQPDPVNIPSGSKLAQTLR